MVAKPATLLRIGGLASVAALAVGVLAPEWRAHLACLLPAVAAFGSVSLPWRKPGERNDPREIRRLPLHPSQVTAEALAEIREKMEALEFGSTEVKERMQVVAEIAEQTRTEIRELRAILLSLLGQPPREAPSNQSRIEELLLALGKRLDRLEEVSGRLQAPPASSSAVEAAVTAVTGSPASVTGDLDENLARATSARALPAAETGESPWKLYHQSLSLGLENLREFCAGVRGRLAPGLVHLVPDRTGNGLVVHDAFFIDAGGGRHAIACKSCGALPASCTFQVFLAAREEEDALWILCPPGPIDRAHYPRVLKALIDLPETPSIPWAIPIRAARLARVRGADPVYQVAIRMQIAPGTWER